MTNLASSVYVKVEAAAPETPAVPVISGVSSTGLTVSWTTVSGATSYTLQRSLNGTSGWVAVYSGTATSYEETELAASTAYYYRLAASNTAGTSAYTANVSATTSAASATTAPATPAGAPTASGTDSDSTIVTWAAVTGAASYTLQRSTSATTGFATVYTGTNLTYTDTALAAATTYYYRYSATNSAGTSGNSSNLTVTTQAAGTNSVRPVAARRIRSRAGMGSHPNFNASTNVWKSDNAQEFCDLVAAAGFTHIRGNLPNGDTGPNGVAYKWATAVRNAGIKWLMVPVGEGTAGRPTDQLPATTTTEVRRIRDLYADICAGIEGINEPNHVRGTGHPIDGWATDAQYGAIAHQKAIWDAARDPLADGSPNPLLNVPILASSLHDNAAQTSYGTAAAPSGGKRHYHQIAEGFDANGVASPRGGMNDAAGKPRYFTHVGQHSYPGGSFPLRGTDERLGNIHAAFPAAPVWLTEHGWHNATKTTAGHVPVTEAVAGTYGIRGLLQHLSAVKNVGGTPDVLRDVIYTYYEGLDDSQSLTAHEERFGAWGVGSGTGADRGSGSATDPTNPATWREKPVAKNMATLLNACKDPAGTAAYTPVNVTCSVTSSAANHNLQWQLTATKAQSDAGVATLWIWRNMDVWDRETKTVITVGKVTATVTDAQGSRNFEVDAEVRNIDLRAATASSSPTPTSPTPTTPTTSALAFTSTPSAVSQFAEGTSPGHTFTWSGPANAVYEVRLDTASNWTFVGSATSREIKPGSGHHVFQVRTNINGAREVIRHQWNYLPHYAAPVTGWKVLVIRTQFSGGTLKQGTTAQNNDRVTAWRSAFSDFSNGLSVPEFTLTPTYTITQPSGTGGQVMWEAGEAAAIAGGYNLSNYRVLMTVNTQWNSGTYNASAELAGNSAYVSHALDPDEPKGDSSVVHEILHCLGLPHSNSLITGAAPTETQLAETPYEYGNPTSIMGGSNPRDMLFHPTGWEKGTQGWITPNVVTANGDYTITSMAQSAPANPQALVVSHPTNPGRRYTLDYRELVGRDAKIHDPLIIGTSTYNYVSGPHVHINNVLIDLAGNTTGTQAHDVGLITGRTYTDPTSGVTFSLVSKTASTATIRVAGLPAV